MLLYRALLYLYPASWRAEYASEMSALFAARRRDAGRFLGLAALWLEVIPDLLLNALAVQWDMLRQDTRHAARSLRRSPGFLVTALAIAALGIGATTAAFTMVDHVLIRPLPFPHADRLVKLREDDLGGLHRFWDVSPANYRDWKRLSLSYESMGAYRALSVNFSGGNHEPQNIDGASFTFDLLPTLRVTPLIGRLFTPEDDRDGAPGTVLLSYGLWQAEFGGDPHVVGQKIYLDNAPYTIIGVMPASFFFPGREARLWTPMRWAPGAFEDRTDTYIFPVGRLKSGISIEQARAEARTIAAQLAHAYPKELAQVGVAVTHLRDDVSERSRLMLKALLGAAICVLLIACMNLANLLMARAMTRRRELAVRTALGAGRERLARQMMTESLMLAIPGGALGLGIAYAALPLLARLVPVSLPIAETPSLDLRVLLFAAAAAFATGIGFGVAPALRAGSTDATELREGGRAGGGRRELLRSSLVVAEVACSIMLLAGFGLLTRALWRIQAVDPGFRPEHLLTLRTSLPMPRYETRQAREPFYRRVLDDTRRLPGVTAAAYTSFLPMVLGGGIWPVEIQGHPEDVAHRRTASLRFITPGFFAAMRIPILTGRDIRESDTHEAPWVAVVSKSFVERYWPDSENPLGRHIDFGNHDRMIVGVVGDIRVRGLERTSEPQVYLSWQQPDSVSTWYAPKDLVVRTTGDPAAIAPALRRIIHSADPGQPVSDVRTMTDIVDEQTETRRVQLAVLGSFGAVALLLAAVGIHGLLAFAVSSRTREIGIRMALGARQADIFNATVADGLKLAGIGVAAGVVMAYGAGRLLESLLAGVQPADFGSLTAAVVIALVMTLAGSALPATRAVRVDPTVAMRAE